MAYTLQDLQCKKCLQVSLNVNNNYIVAIQLDQRYNEHQLYALIMLDTYY